MNYLARSRISVFKALVSAYKIRVLPNDNNQIKAAQRKPQNTVDTIDHMMDNATSHLKALQCIGCCGCVGDCFRMDRKIVKSSLYVLDKCRAEQDDEKDRQQLETRMRHIEHSLQQIVQRLDGLAK